MVPKSKNRLTVSTISYQITKSLDIKNVLSNFPYPTIALYGHINKMIQQQVCF